MNEARLEELTAAINENALRGLSLVQQLRAELAGGAPEEKLPGEAPGEAPGDCQPKTYTWDEVKTLMEVILARELGASWQELKDPQGARRRDNMNRYFVQTAVEIGGCKPKDLTPEQLWRFADTITHTNFLPTGEADLR